MEQPHVTQQYFSPADIAEWAKAVQTEKGYSQQQIADELTELRGDGILVRQSQVSEALSGNPSRASLLLTWLEAHAPAGWVFETDADNKPIKYFKLEMNA